MTKKLKVLTALVAITAMFWTVGKAVSAHGWGEHEDDFQLFGAARLVTGGIVPHNVAVDLTSNCGTLPFIASPPASVCDSSSSDFVVSGVAFIPDKGHPLTLKQIITLSADFNMNGGTDCIGGSPRYIIFTNTNNNNFEGNFGKFPFPGSFPSSNCYLGWQNTGNVTTTSDPTLRWQTKNGNTYDTWNTIVTGHGTEMVTEIDIVLDGGWKAFRGQDLEIDDFTINKEVMNFSEENHGH